ncbi:MAG: DUF5615 family PIN-like protein [Verrucomicrobiota bacterium]
MKFVVDAQLPPALADLLNTRGHEAEHVTALRLESADDTRIWDHALERGSVIVTKDEDFPHRLSQNPSKAPVVLWLRVGNTSRRALLEWFEPLLADIESLLQRGDQLVEVR